MAVPSDTQGAIVDVIAKFMNSNMSEQDAVAALEGVDIRGGTAVDYSSDATVKAGYRPNRPNANSRVSRPLAPQVCVLPRPRSRRALVFVYGFIPITVALSFTESRLLPNWSGPGWSVTPICSTTSVSDQREKIWQSFGGLFIGISLIVDPLLAIPL